MTRIARTKLKYIPGDRIIMPNNVSKLIMSTRILQIVSRIYSMGPVSHKVLINIMSDRLL